MFSTEFWTQVSQSVFVMLDTYQNSAVKYKTTFIKKDFFRMLQTFMQHKLKWKRIHTDKNTWIEDINNAKITF